MILALTVMMLFSGCIRMRGNIDVDIFGRLNTSFEYSYASSIKTMFGKEYDLDSTINKYLEEYKKEGYTCTSYKDGEYEGYILSKNKITVPSDEIFGGEGSVKLEGFTYVLDIPFSLENSEVDLEYLKEMGELISIQGGYADVVITLPVRPVSHNATSVSEDGKTLTWNLLAMGERSSVHVEYSLWSFILIWALMAIIALAAVAIVIVVIVLISKAVLKRKKKAAEEKENEEKEAENDVNASENEENVTAKEDETMEKLRRYKAMLDEELITREDYEKKKNELLGIEDTDKHFD